MVSNYIILQIRYFYTSQMKRKSRFVFFNVQYHGVILLRGKNKGDYGRHLDDKIVNKYIIFCDNMRKMRIEQCDCKRKLFFCLKITACLGRNCDLRMYKLISYFVVIS